MSDTETIEMLVNAAGSTDAQAKAKRLAREQGYRIKTIAGISCIGDYNPKIQQSWIVRLAVRA